MAKPAPSSRQPRLGAQIGGWALFVAIETATQVVFKVAGATLDGPGGFWALAARALMTPVVLAGFALYFLGFLVWMTILRDVDLGRAFPMTASIYLTTLAAAVLLFHEHLNPLRIIGVVVIIAGVALMASDKDSQPAAPPPI